jgi:hypothetical protein
MSVAFAGLALSRAQKMAELLTVGAERRVLWFYPISNRDFFRWGILRFVARSTWIVILAAVVYVVARDATGFNGWVVRITAPLAEWLVVLCIALALVRRVDVLPKWLPLAFYVVAGLILFAPDRYGKAATPLASALPTGWLHVVLMNREAQEWTGWIAMGGVFALGFLCWQLLKRLETISCREEAAIQEAASGMEESTRPAEEAQDVIDRFAAEQARAEEEQASEAAIEAAGEAVLPIQAAWQRHRFENWGSEVGEVVRQGQWLKRWNWNAMRPIERVAGWCLNEREKGEAQFLLGPMTPRWSNRWPTSAIATAVGVAATITGATWEFNMVSVLAFGVSIASGVPVLGGAWPATNQGRISGKFSPIFGCYPISYWTAGWIMFKANAVRTAAWVPLGVVMAVLYARTAHTTFADGCGLLARAVLLFVALSPILLSGKFSKVTNDTLNLRLRALPLVGLFLAVIFAVATFGAGVFLASGWWPVVFLGLAALLSWAWWAVYGWYYQRGQVDLLREQV